MPKHYKIYLFGGRGVGKTSLIELLQNGSLPQTYHATIGDIYEIKLKTERGNKEHVSIFDTEGLDEKLIAVPNYYLATADAAVFVFGVNSMASFDLVKRLRADATKVRGNELPVVVLGTKSDLSKEREVSNGIINSWSKECKVKFFETVQGEQDSIKTPFTWLISRLTDKAASHQNPKLFRLKKSPSFPTASALSD